MKDWTQTAVARALFRSRYDMYETLSKFSKALVTILDLKALTEEIIRTLVSVMGIQTATLYILDKEKDLYVPVSSHGLPADQEKAAAFTMMADELPYHLTRFQSILVLHELEQGPEARKLESLAGTLRALQAEVCLPLVNKNRLIGFCNLGARTSDRIYSDQDLRLLTTLAQEAAIALDNAMLYEDLKRSQSLVQRTDRLRSLETIAEGFAHEVRNPLTSIKTFIQLAPDRKEDPDFLGRFSHVVSEDVTRIERLIQEIFDYARYMKPKFKEEDLNSIVESCLYVIEINIAKKPVSIAKDLGVDLPPVLVDRQQIKQILLNLFLNALEALPERGGLLTVKTHRLTKSPRDPWVQVEVTDNGPGISPADLEHIFDPFFSTKHVSTEREGTGLGLTIVHQIVQEHSGYIEVTSEVGKGTTFLVNLPVNPHQFVEKKRTHLG
jgi:signal transduction histidine kinase